MTDRSIEWHEPKNRDNLRKHGVDFSEAASVLDDPKVLSIEDVEHSSVEDRTIWIGFSNRLRLLMVVTTDRDYETIRIISARRATKAESRRYAV